MTEAKVLSQDDLDHFETHGYIIFPGAFDPDDCRQMEDIVWRWLERHDIMRNDPSTWDRNQAGGLSRTVRSTRVFRDAVSEQFVSAIDQLLGKGSWEKPRDWGSLGFSFPEALDEQWNVASGNWHWHNSGFRNVDKLDGLFNFSFITEVQSHGGGTHIADGSHHLIRHFYRTQEKSLFSWKDKIIKKRFFSTHPWLRELTQASENSNTRVRRLMDQTTDVNGFPLRIIELTGKPGDAMIGHPLLMHCRSTNCADVPRFMRACEIHTTADK